MSYRLDPQIDDRLAQLVAALPASTPPRVADLRPPYRTPRWVLVLVALILIVAAVVSYIWLTHTDPLPSSATLSCNGVDPFRCHMAAGAAMDVALRRGDSGSALDNLIVRAANYAEAACGLRHCPASIMQRLESLHIDLQVVTITLRDQHMQASYWVVWCPGKADPAVALEAKAGPASLSRMMPPPSCAL